MKLHFLRTKWSDMIILESAGKIALVDTGTEEQYDYLERNTNYHKDNVSYH